MMTEPSAHIGVGRTYTRVRGGGYGSGAWIARIVGLDTQYVFERRFCRRDESGLSGSGRSGVIEFEVEEPGIYEFRGFCVGTTPKNWEWSGFCELAADGGFKAMSRSDVVQHFRQLAAEHNEPHEQKAEAVQSSH